MAIDARIRQLDSRHQTLARAIEAEVRRPGVDPLQLSEMKRRKMRLKEQIEGLRHPPAH